MISADTAKPPSTSLLMRNWISFFERTGQLASSCTTPSALHGQSTARIGTRRCRRRNGGPDSAQAGAGARTRFSAWAVRTDHDTVQMIAVMVNARLRIPFNATNVVVGRRSEER